ncbi:hypothetical protein GQX74_014049 [Glossina fuscipes]|nr:hypothetical protein GQX74_014049 [Glossina fuscipes]
MTDIMSTLIVGTLRMPTSTTGSTSMIPSVTATMSSSSSAVSATAAGASRMRVAMATSRYSGMPTLIAKLTHSIAPSPWLKKLNVSKNKSREENQQSEDSLRSGGNASVSMPSSSISIPAIFEYLRSFCNLTSVSGGTGLPSITTDDLNISNQFLLNTFPSKNTDVYINLEIIHIPSPYMTRLVFCLLYSTDFTEEEGRGFGRFFGCNEYRRPLRGGRACCSASEA